MNPVRMNRRLLVFLASLLAGGIGRAEDREATNSAAAKGPAADLGYEVKRTGFLIATRNDLPKVFAPIEGAKKAVLAPAFEWEYGVRLFSKEKWLAQKYDWATYQEEALRHADSLVEALKPEFRRDARGVIDYALVLSDDPFLSSILFSRKLLPYFEAKLGKRLRVAVPDRTTLYVFPADGGKLEGYGPALVEKFEEARYPVTLEVFLVDETGVRVIGELER